MEQIRKKKWYDNLFRSDLELQVVLIGLVVLGFDGITEGRRKTDEAIR